MTTSEISVGADRRQVRPISRTIVSTNLPHAAKIRDLSVQSMKETAEKRENEMHQP